TRQGRYPVGRRLLCATAFGNIDLDLRGASLPSDVTTIFVLGSFCAVDIYVPEGVEVDVRGLAIGGHRRVRGNDPQPRPGAPLVRVYSLTVFAGFDVWRVPAAWAQKTWSEVIKGIRAGTHRELGA
ncbi:MAG: LiaF domain-containing protein, partial [Gaiellaceae bacterium]